MAEAAAEEFASLSEDQKQYFRVTGLGRFGAYSLMTTFEVQALKIVALEMDRTHCFHADFAKACNTLHKLQELQNVSQILHLNASPLFWAKSVDWNYWDWA